MPEKKKLKIKKLRRLRKGFADREKEIVGGDLHMSGGF